MDLSYSIVTPIYNLLCYRKLNMHWILSLWTCIWEEIILILMIGIITVIIHAYAILMKYYHEYPKHSREVWARPASNYLFAMCCKEPERLRFDTPLTGTWHSCPLCAFNFHICWLCFNTAESWKQQLYKF